MLTVNEYFDGQVKSISFQTATLPATVGVMAPGDYEFNTSQKETITIVSGSMSMKLRAADEWQTFVTGENFIVAANNTFQLKIDVDTAYLCIYE